MKKKILIFTEYFLPGYKGGGPIQSIKNLIRALNHDFDFFVVTNDRDLNEKEPYKDVLVNKWNSIENIQIFYLQSRFSEVLNLFSILNKAEILYFNSFFSIKFTFIPLLITKFFFFKTKRIILSPRGEFNSGALGIKKLKKKIYIKMFKIFNLEKNIIWQSTNQLEKEEIGKYFCLRKNCIKLSVPIFNFTKDNYPIYRFKKNGILKLLFFSRIAPKKNLIGALKILRELDEPVEFNIYGVIDDFGYWEQCKNLINEMPEKLKINYKGEINHNHIFKMFNENHLFFFPTLGENFGHVIFESLASGVPLLISDRTPWKEIEKFGVGWQFSLQEKNKFIEIIRYFFHMDNDEYQKISKKAIDYTQLILRDDKSIAKFKMLFDRL